MYFKKRTKESFSKDKKEYLKKMLTFLVVYFEVYRLSLNRLVELQAGKKPCGVL